MKHQELSSEIQNIIEQAKRNKQEFEARANQNLTLEEFNQKFESVKLQSDNTT